MAQSCVLFFSTKISQVQNMFGCTDRYNYVAFGNVATSTFSFLSVLVFHQTFYWCDLHRRERAHPPRHGGGDTCKNGARACLHPGHRRRQASEEALLRPATSTVGLTAAPLGSSSSCSASLLPPITPLCKPAPTPPPPRTTSSRVGVPQCRKVAHGGHWGDTDPSRSC